MNMPSYIQERLLTPLRRSKQSSRSSQHAGSIDFSKKKVTDTIATTSSQQDSWLFHVVATLGGCFAPSLKREKKQAGLPPQDFSVSSLNDGLSQSSGSSLSSHYAPLEGKPKAITFTMAELIKATENFSPSLKIGQGGFGVVYKGRLPDGRLVAIKRARKHEFEMQLSMEFHSELATLTNVEHLNLVKFMGYLDESSERILVVEYVSNGNLRQHLDGKFGVILDLATRLDIAIDVAHAVTYLHLYADQPIIHRDIKSSNVLLTENFRAKVADFGFSRLGPWDVDATHVSTQVKGTAGYLDPEYLKTYQLTQKSDVYSFGVLLVELVTGRSPIELKRESKERVTTKWAFQMFLDGKSIEALDPKLEKSPLTGLMVERVLELAFHCAAPTKQQRPSMKKTAELLWNIRKDYRSFWRNRPVRHSSEDVLPSSSSSSSPRWQHRSSPM